MQRSLTRVPVPLHILLPFVPSTLSFFLLLSLFPSLSGVPLFTSLWHSYLSPFFSLSRSLSRSLLSRSSRCYRSQVSHSLSLSSVSLIFLLFSSAEALLLSVLLLVVLVSRVVLFLFFHPFSYSPAGGSFSTRVRAGVSLPLIATSAAAAASTLLSFHHLPLLATSPFSLILFCPCRSRCSALFEFKRGSRRCLVSPS